MNRYSVCILSILIVVTGTRADAVSTGLANGYGGARWDMSSVQVDSALSETQYVYKSSRTGEVSYYDSLGGLEADIIPRFVDDSLREIRLIFNVMYFKRLAADTLFERIASEIIHILGRPENTIGLASGMGAIGQARREASWSTPMSGVRLEMRGDSSGNLQMQLSVSSRYQLDQVKESRAVRSDSLSSSKRRNSVEAASLPGGVGMFPEPNDFIAVEQMPVLIRDAVPAYPEMALMEGTEGSVWVKALVDREGKVRDAEIAKTAELDVGFEAAALDAAYEKIYKPAMKNGEPVAVWMVYRVDFELE